MVRVRPGGMKTGSEGPTRSDAFLVGIGIVVQIRIQNLVSPTRSLQDCNPHQGIAPVVENDAVLLHLAVG